MKKVLNIFLILATILLSGESSISEPVSFQTEYPNPKIRFRKNSVVLSITSKAEIKRLYNFLPKLCKDTSKIFEEFTIELTPHSSESEYKRNKYIGVQRAIEIIDYLTENYKVPRGSVFIREINCYEDFLNESEIGVVFSPKKIR